jgi:hypothetical protein
MLALDQITFNEHSTERLPKKLQSGEMIGLFNTVLSQFETDTDNRMFIIARFVFDVR